MKKFLLTTGATLSMLYWAAAPAMAATLCPTDSQFAGLCNNTPSAEGIVGWAINMGLFIAFVAALGYLIYGGIRWIMSGGDKEGTAKAKGTVTAALIGLAIVLGSWILINIVLQIFNIGSVGSLTLPTLKPIK